MEIPPLDRRFESCTSPLAAALLDWVISATDSEQTYIGQDLAHAVAHKEITSAEFELLDTATRDQRRDLNAKRASEEHWSLIVSDERWSLMDRAYEQENLDPAAGTNVVSERGSLPTPATAPKLIPRQVGTGKGGSLQPADDSKPWAPGDVLDGIPEPTRLDPMELRQSPNDRK